MGITKGWVAMSTAFLFAGFAGAFGFFLRLFHVPIGGLRLQILTKKHDFAVKGALVVKTTRARKDAPLVSAVELEGRLNGWNLEARDGATAGRTTCDFVYIPAARWRFAFAAPNL